MRTPSATTRTPARTPARPRRARGASRAIQSGPSEPLAAWIDSVATMLNDADPSTRERGLAELRRGLERGPHSWSEDALATLAAVANAAAHSTFGTQPEMHLVLARMQHARGERAGAETSLWHATFGAARLASSNLPTDRARAAKVNREASRIWGDLGNAYQRDARNAIGRYFTARLTHPIAALPVLRAWPDVGRSETSDRRQPTMGPPQAAVPVPTLLKNGNARPGDSPPPRMSGIAVPRMSVLDLINTIGSLVGVVRRAQVLAAYLRECASARANRDELPMPNLPSVVRELEASLKRAAGDANLPESKRAAAQQVLESLDFGYLLESAIAYWGTAR